MAKLQGYFEKFHDAIRTDYDMNETLRGKRDIVLGKIAEDLKKKNRPPFDPLMQGSYQLKTGVTPIADLEFDIDVGLRFEIDPDKVGAAQARAWVFDAVKDHTKSVEDKANCVRVNYVAGYHLDLVVYACSEGWLGKKIQLGHKTNGWRDADPQGLNKHILDHAKESFTDTEDNIVKLDQLRRTVRYLKRWYDVQVPKEAPALKPSGLAFSLYAIEKLTKTLDADDRPDDATALKDLAETAADTWGRISTEKPTPEYDDVFAGIEEAGMKVLKSRFKTLAQTIDSALVEPDPVVACKLLRGVLGDDFPVPDPDDTGKKTKRPAIITSSTSA